MVKILKFPWISFYIVLSFDFAFFSFFGSILRFNVLLEAEIRSLWVGWLRLKGCCQRFHSIVFQLYCYHFGSHMRNLLHQILWHQLRSILYFVLTTTSLLIHLRCWKLSRFKTVLRVASLRCRSSLPVDLSPNHLRFSCAVKDFLCCAIRDLGSIKRKQCCQN